MAELSTMARPYAKAVFEYAAGAGDLENWSNVLALLAAVVTEEKVQVFLSSPATTQEQQASAVTSLCGEELSPQQANLISVLAENRRLPLLPDISVQFEALKSSREKSIQIEVISAGDLSAEQQQKLAAALSARLERQVSMEVKVDKNLIGGAVVRAGDTVIDGSVRGRLNKLAEALNT